jgi:hypothetical protein
VDRIVRLGDGWIPIMGATLDEIREGVTLLRKAYGEAAPQRDPATLQVRAPVIVARGADGKVDLDATMASVPDLVAAGVTELRADLRLTVAAYDDPPTAFAQLTEAFHAHL